ncbi:hypothetical protein LXA43DRAFT_289577 [Ganoderma leucocontextum]|nr:hypothetical protein LXA43DRAFT_289577 [Ganoderma leucocontextum]
MVVADYPPPSISEPADNESFGPSTAGTSSDLTGSSRKTHHPRSRHFLNKHDSKVHAFDSAKAPWPLSYDKATLELEMMDNALTSQFKGVVSLVDHKGKEPARCLDIGTGLGLWVVNSAKYWKTSTFVGFDLVDVQIPLRILDADVASRIEWVYGNILIDPLPFDDEEFDHVRVTEVALGIPEDHWTNVFEEIRRVMKHGGTIEIIEEDAIFPVLPRWFTEPLHARTRWPPSISMQDGSKFFSNPKVSSHPDVAHEYELLEILFEKVFDRRFVNTKPSSTLPAPFSTCFGHVISPPVLTVPMPPLPPVQPRPPPRSSSSSQSDSSYGERDLLYDPNAKGEISLATFNKPASRKKSSRGTRSNRQSTVGMPFGAPIPESSPLVRSYSDGPPQSTRSGSDLGQEQRPPPPPPPSPISTTVTASGVPISGPGSKGAEMRSSRSNSVSSMMSMASKRTAAIHDLAASSTVIGGRTQIELFPVDGLLMFDVHSLCLHLRRGLGFVLAIREAMWEELAALVTSPGGSDVDLTKYGFFPHEDTLQSMRSKYVQLLDQYKHDMHVRMSLWHSLVHFGWDYPQRDPMSKAEEMEEMRLREDILTARRNAGAENDREPHCRAVRMLVGVRV